MKKLFDSAVSRRSFLGGAAAVSALGLAACGGNDTPSGGEGEGGETTSGGGTITAGSAYAPSEYNPTKTSSAFCLGSNWHVLEGLYGTDPHDYSTFPELATGDPEQVDETTFTVTLREGAAFSNGNAVTTADVVESFDRTKADATYSAFLSPIDSLEATDDTTITVKTAIANFSLLKERLALVRVFPAGTSDARRLRPLDVQRDHRRHRRPRAQPQLQRLLPGRGRWPALRHPRRRHRPHDRPAAGHHARHGVRHR